MKNSNAEIASVGSRVPRDRATQSWPMVRLGDVCDASTSQIRQKDLESNSGEFPIYGASGLITKVAFYQSKTECLGVVKDGAGVGRVMYLPPFSSVIGTVLIIKPRPSIINQYLYHVLVQLDLGAVHSGATIPHVYFKDFKDRSIPLPPLSVQREIVTRLEKELGEADALAAKFKEIAENADAEFKAELDETFKNVEGETVRLGDVFKFIDYRGMTPVKTESGVPLITAKNVRQGFLDYKEESFISNEDYKNRQTRGIAHKGDILFTTEAPLGFVALADKDEFSTGQRIITFQQKHDDSNWCNKYFLYCLMSDWFQKQLWRQATGATAKGIKSSRLIELPVLVISSQCQKAIAGRLDKIKSECEKLKAAAERGLRAAEDLRKAILAEAFEQ